MPLIIGIISILILIIFAVSGVLASRTFWLTILSLAAIAICIFIVTALLNAFHFRLPECLELFILLVIISLVVSFITITFTSSDK